MTNGYREPARVIKWDLKGFFPNANLDIMCGMYEDLIERHADEIISNTGGEEIPDFLRWLAMVIIHCRPQEHCELRTPWTMWGEHIEQEKSLFTKGPGRGAPIGRMVSQTGMGMYLNDEVCWLNDDCGIRSTLFMDDCVMVVPERLHQYALSLFPVLRQRLAAKDVRMNEKKFYDQSYQHGLEFLGSHIRPWSAILNDSTFTRAIARVKEYNDIPDAEKYQHLDRFISTVNSFTGLLKNRTSFRQICQLRDTIAPAWWQWLEWDDRRQCVVGNPQNTYRQRLEQKYHLNLKHI